MTDINWTLVQQRLIRNGINPGPIDGIKGGRTISGVLSFAARRDLGDFAVKAGSICATMFPKYGIDLTAERLSQFVATTSHETGDYSEFSENLSYLNPALLVKNWPNRFNLATAILYLRNPRKLADKVYGGRYGNRPGTTDAYDFRGGGWIQTTFRANYLDAQRVTGLPLAAHPELLHDPLTSIEPACAYWKGRGCNEVADADPSGRKARILVNGGTIGLDDVIGRTARLMKLLAQ